MKQDYTKILTDILGNLAHLNHIQPSEIPHINLYMDQVTGFMEEHLSNSKRFEDDKILTKTMINNYAKNKLLPPPEKKRYSKEHMYMLIFIYYLKGFLPLTDIQAILKPISDEFFGSDSDFCMEDIYKEVFRLGEENISDIGHDILENFHTAANSFKDYDGEDRDTLQLFAFICLLSFDIYLKKEVIEQLIDAMEKKTAELTKKQERRPDVLLLSWHRLSLLFFSYSSSGFSASSFSFRRLNTISYPSLP